MNSEDHVESPCNRICTIDSRTELCIGCFRTLDEIGFWTRMSNGERAAVLERLPARRTAFEAGENWARLTCGRCGAQFSCGADDPTRPCWCVGYPAVTPTDAAAKCLCPACLSAAPQF